MAFLSKIFGGNKSEKDVKKINHYVGEINARNKEADDLPFNDLMGKDAIYQQVDKLKKDRNKKIEEALLEILPEAFAVVKETARRFKENEEIVSTATDLDRDL